MYNKLNEILHKRKGQSDFKEKERWLRTVHPCTYLSTGKRKMSSSIFIFATIETEAKSDVIYGMFRLYYQALFSKPRSQMGFYVYCEKV